MIYTYCAHRPTSLFLEKSTSAYLSIFSFQPHPAILPTSTSMPFFMQFSPLDVLSPILSNSYLVSKFMLIVIFYEAILIYWSERDLPFWPPSSCPQYHLFIWLQGTWFFFLLFVFIISINLSFQLNWSLLQSRVIFILSTMAPKTEPGTELVIDTYLLNE